jgi:CO/xanthine dehydrogenase Mo-binding subunit
LGTDQLLELPLNLFCCCLISFVLGGNHKRLELHKPQFILSNPQVVSKTKRLGGGFGGKETRSIFLHCAAAVPAHVLKRPVKMTLDRDEDMQMTGVMSEI